MTNYTDFVKLHMSKLDKSIPAKERFKMIAKMWQANKPAGQEVVKAVKATKAKATKAKGGDFLTNVIDVMKEAAAVKAKGGNMKAKGGDFMDMFPVLKLFGGGDMKANKAKPAKRSAKAKGGALVDMHALSDDDDDEQAQPSVNVIEKLKANTIKRGGYQGFQGHYPDAINESVMQQLVKKR